MSGNFYHKRYHSDALAGMMNLTLEERGAYNTLLDMMYDRGGPLIDNERLLAGYMGCSIRKWRSLRDILIEKRKIRINKDGLITNGRTEKEIENASKTHRKRVETGSKGGRTRAENEKLSNENNEGGQGDLEATLSEPQAILQLELDKSSVDKSTGGKPPIEDPVRDLFDLGVSILTKAGNSEKEARSLIGKWRQGGKRDAEVLVALLECRTKLISQPVEWLTKRLKPAKYVSATGFEYKGDIDAIIRESERRADWGTHWAARKERDQGKAH
jgi:uncharacterized protein YdaU (DUF1376 family)